MDTKETNKLKMPVTVDVHGSCVSRTCFEKIDKKIIQVNHYFSRNNIVSCMMPPVNLTFSHGELVSYNSEYAERCMRFALNKQTVPLLLESSSEYIILDFFDFCQPVAGFFDTTFSTYDYTFYNTSAYKSNQKDICIIDFLSIPKCLWYGYVDAYFIQLKKRFQDHIILNRLNCSQIFITKDDKIKDIPPNLCNFGNAKYNQALYELENYIIEKYSPYVIDISKYFIPDANYNPDATPVHFEENYFILQSEIIKQILLESGGVKNILIF